MMLKLVVLVSCFALCATESCHDLWYNHCTDNADCCSGNCFKGDDGSWGDGVCKPKNDKEGSAHQGGTNPSPSSSGCHELWYNKCTDNSQCCSGNCFMGDDGGLGRRWWQEGLCKPKE